MISDERRDKALQYLATTDEECALAQSYYNSMKSLTKQVEGASTSDKTKSYSDGTYKDHIEKVEIAELSYLKIKNKRMTEAMIIECWRSENANRRVANVT